MFEPWLRHSHRRHDCHDHYDHHDHHRLRHFQLLIWSCSHYGGHQCRGTYIHAEHLHKPIDFADIGIRSIDDGYRDGVTLISLEIPRAPEEDGDILIRGVRLHYFSVDPI